MEASKPAIFEAVGMSLTQAAREEGGASYGELSHRGMDVRGYWFLPEVDGSLHFTFQFKGPGTLHLHWCTMEKTKVPKTVLWELRSMCGKAGGELYDGGLQQRTAQITARDAHKHRTSSFVLDVPLSEKTVPKQVARALRKAAGLPAALNEYLWAIKLSRLASNTQDTYPGRLFVLSANGVFEDKAW